MSIQPLLPVAIFAIGLSAGWMVNGWRHEAQEVAVHEAVREAMVKAVARQVEVSDGLQKTLDELDKKRLVNTKETFHETTKIEYRCILPERGRLLYNSAAAESAAAIEP